MKEKIKKFIPLFVVTALIFVILLGVVIVKVVQRYTPSKERVDINEYYNVNGSDAALIYNDVMTEDLVKVIDNNIYIDIDDVTSNFNQRFYWDSYEGLLIYTTDKDVIKTYAGTKEYTVSGQKNNTEYDIVKIDGQNVYVALDYIKKYTKIDYEYYENPGRLYLYSVDGTYQTVKAKKKSVIRRKGGIKSLIVTDVKKGEELKIIEEIDGWTKVKTEDGYIGYISNKHLAKDRGEQTRTIEYTDIVYTGIKKDYDISLVFHQVTNVQANAKIWDLMDKTKGVNTICPTWFQLSDTQGNINSLADYSYVQSAKAKGYEVWGLVSNLEIKVDMYELLAHTTSRENLANQLIGQAVASGLDGINVDFESLDRSCGPAYIQFIRELAIKCHNNGIVLSIDDYVPSESTEFYNRKEQGIVADYVIIMGYDEHWGTSKESGSVASIGFVEAGIKDTLEDVPKEKLINAIPFYTRLWTETTDANGQVNVTSKTYDMNTSKELLYASSNLVEWNEECGQYYGGYVNDDGSVCKMWLEDARSIEEKMKLIDKYDLAGVACWKLGLESEDVWDVIPKYINN